MWTQLPGILLQIPKVSLGYNLVETVVQGHHLPGTDDVDRVVRRESGRRKVPGESLDEVLPFTHNKIASAYPKKKDKPAKIYWTAPPTYTRTAKIQQRRGKVGSHNNSSNPGRLVGTRKKGLFYP